MLIFLLPFSPSQSLFRHTYFISFTIFYCEIQHSYRKMHKINVYCNYSELDPSVTTVKLQKWNITSSPELSTFCSHMPDLIPLSFSLPFLNVRLIYHLLHMLLWGLNELKYMKSLQQCVHVVIPTVYAGSGFWMFPFLSH